MKIALLSVLAASVPKINGDKLPVVVTDCAPGAADCTPPIVTALNFFYALAGAITLLVIMIASLRYVLSRGQAEKVKQAKETIIYALIGLVLVISAYAITYFIYGRIT